MAKGSENMLREIIKEPPVYDGGRLGAHFPSLIDLAYEAVHMGADQQAQRLLDLRRFLIDYFEELDAITYAERSSNEEDYRVNRPRTLG